MNIASTGIPSFAHSPLHQPHSPPASPMAIIQENTHGTSTLAPNFLLPPLPIAPPSTPLKAPTPLLTGSTAAWLHQVARNHPTARPPPPHPDSPSTTGCHPDLKQC